MSLVLLLMVLLLRYVFIIVRLSSHETNTCQLNAAITSMPSSTPKKLQTHSLCTPHKQEPACLMKRLTNPWKKNQRTFSLLNTSRRLHSSMFLPLSQISTRFWIMRCLVPKELLSLSFSILSFWVLLSIKERTIKYYCTW